MCHQPLSDKGWLRQFIPTPTPDQLHDFINRVGMMIDAYPRPTEQQTQAAREYAYRTMMGALAP